MMRQVGGGAPPVGIALGKAAFPAPFPGGLEYSAPARGVWNIVHAGMLVPQAHEIYVCAQGCLRGVVLTAAEMGASARFSTVTIEEHDLYDGDMESLLIEGVTDILQLLPMLPPAVLVYSSCVHHFMATDLALCYRELRARFPGVAFTDCYMNPIMRKSGLTPDQLMRRQLYSLLAPLEQDGGVNFVGSFYALNRDSDLVQLIAASGRTLREITACKTYEDYLQMARGSLNLITHPAAEPVGPYLQEKLGQRYLYLPVAYRAAEIRQQQAQLAQTLELPVNTPQLDAAQAQAMQALDEARACIGGAPIALDHTATMRPLALVRLLVEAGFCVERLYCDSFAPLEAADFSWLQCHAPEITLLPTTAPRMRVEPRKSREKTLAIGQKAAYFTGSAYFVNLVEGGGLSGFAGIAHLAGRMREAFLHPKDTQRLIEQKGFGCGCCL